MKLIPLIAYYLMAAFWLAWSVVQYANDHVSKACFALIGVGILLVLNEVKRNARITTNYFHCEFISAPPPQPAPDDTGPIQKEPYHGGTGLQR